VIHTLIRQGGRGVLAARLSGFNLLQPGAGSSNSSASFPPLLNTDLKKVPLCPSAREVDVVRPFVRKQIDHPQGAVALKSIGVKYAV
jgi:hypothetical protein